MKLQKWKDKLNKYKSFIPLANYLGLSSNNLEELAECVNCGITSKYGDMPTSRTIHADPELGLGLCEQCYQLGLAELKELEMYNDVMSQRD